MKIEQKTQNSWIKVRFCLGLKFSNLKNYFDFNISRNILACNMKVSSNNLVVKTQFGNPKLFHALKKVQNTPQMGDIHKMCHTEILFSSHVLSCVSNATPSSFHFKNMTSLINDLQMFPNKSVKKSFNLRVLERMLEMCQHILESRGKAPTTVDWRIKNKKDESRKSNLFVTFFNARAFVWTFMWKLSSFSQRFFEWKVDKFQQKFES